MSRSTRFLDAVARRPVDATPVWFMRQAGRSLPEYRAIRERLSLLEIIDRPEICAEVTLQPVERLGVDAAVLFADITLPFLGLGVGFDIVPGVGPTIDSPLRSPDDIDRLAPYDLAHAEPLLEAIRLVGRASPVPLIGFAGAPFTLASYLVEGGPTRRFLEVKGLMLRHPEAWGRLMAILTDATIAYLGAQIEAGVQAVQLFDSWVGALAPEDYRRLVQPHVERVFAALPEVPTIHFGTAATGLLPDLAAAGGDVVGLDWRVDLARGWELVGDGRGIQGNLDPAVLLGPWPEVDRRARAVLAAAGGRAGHVFNLGHGVLPETPVDHLRRLVELVHDVTSVGHADGTEPAP